jgi:outer membrane protein OmpA-like peptidoglycan-associated protein
MKIKNILSALFLGIFLLAGLDTFAQKKTKSVEPLYWKNPLEFAYSELNSPKRMKMPKVVLDDADGDGVTDQFDREPNTPAGAPVNSNGVSKDTDGDGVPDFKDKQLITPSECQPVDVNGVGKCPEPPCCKLIPPPAPPTCNMGNIPSVSFAKGSAKLSKDAESILASTADRLKNNPVCKVFITGYAEASKASQQLSWDRVNSIITYLSEQQGIAADRLINKYGQTEGDANVIDLSATGENTGEPNTVPAPHPNLRTKK